MTAAPSSQPTPEHPQGPGPYPSVQVPAGYVLAPAPKKKGFVRRHKLLSLILLVVVVVVLAQLAGGGDDGAPALQGRRRHRPVPRRRTPGPEKNLPRPPRLLRLPRRPRVSAPPSRTASCSSR